MTKSDEVILKVENLSKQYRLGLVGTGTLSHDLNRWWHRVRGKEDPYLKIGETNDRSQKGESEYVWALKDINFEVKRGEVLGIIGKNGAGKSTLLKILSKVTSPTTGSVKTRGRIASLLEVGTGFHGEMTGRENIYLNGAILGMTKKEIASKIDEIIDFSGCARYIDTPVKRYSSGMTVRLAFAVAAFLEPDILIVDEVLAVGDAEFQKKAIGKMKDISSGEGRTVLFVSHNMEAVKRLCSKAILLSNGGICFHGKVDNVMKNYLSLTQDDLCTPLENRLDRKGNNNLFKFTNLELRDNEGKMVSTLFSGDYLEICVSYQNAVGLNLTDLVIGVAIQDLLGNFLVMWASDEMNFKLIESKKKLFKLIIPQFNFRAGEYGIWLFSSHNGTNKENFCDVLEHAIQFKVLSKDFWMTGKKNRDNSIFYMSGNFINT